MSVVEQRARGVVDLRLDGQPGLAGAAEVVEGDGVVVEGEDRVQGLVGSLRAEVGAGLVAVVVVQRPQQRRPALVELPVDRAGRRRRGVGRVVDERLELRPGVLVVGDLRLLDVLGEAGPGAVPVGDRGVEVVERAERVPGVFRAFVVVVVLVRARRLPQRRLVGRGQEPVERVERRDGVAAGLLAVEAPRAAGVGIVAARGVGGVVPVGRRDPVVRAFLLTGRAELGAATCTRPRR